MRNSVTQPRVLGKIKSSSNPNKYYDIKLGADGVVYCSCVAWKMSKWCKHLEEYHGRSQASSISPSSGSSSDKVLIKFFEESHKKNEPVDAIELFIESGVKNGKW